MGCKRRLIDSPKYLGFLVHYKEEIIRGANFFPIAQRLRNMPPVFLPLNQ